MADIHVGDIGTMFKLTIVDQDGIPVPMDNSFVVTMTFLLPDKSTIDRTASFLTDGSDGIVKYITVAGDLTQAGRWQLQAVVKKMSGPTILQEYHSDSVKIKVVANLE